MFDRLFAESGLSLDRLRALLAVGAAGSIVKAAGGDPVRQSQYSRQVKELEGFFRLKLLERQGRGIRLTPSGRELARISRFFMLGLANFQRGGLGEGQTFTIGAGATLLRRFLLPVLAQAQPAARPVRYATEGADRTEIERRLHELTLDFGVVSGAGLSRPLETQALGSWGLQLWLPSGLGLTPARAAQAFGARRLPLVLARNELAEVGPLPYPGDAAQVVCESFLEARAALEGGRVAALLPAFLAPAKSATGFLRVPVPALRECAFGCHLAWNPRLLRLNPHAVRQRDWLLKALQEGVKQ